MDRWNKKEVKHRVGVREKMSDVVGWKVLKWLGHMERMCEKVRLEEFTCHM